MYQYYLCNCCEWRHSERAATLILRGFLWRIGLGLSLCNHYFCLEAYSWTVRHYFSIFFISKYHVSFLKKLRGCLCVCICCSWWRWSTHFLCQVSGYHAIYYREWGGGGVGGGGNLWVSMGVRESKHLKVKNPYPSPKITNILWK